MQDSNGVKRQSTVSTVLPTGTFESWTVTSLRESLIAELASDRSSTTLRMFFYAVTSTGWSEIRRPVLKWMRSRTSRSVTAYVGTDHAMTDPAAIESMKQARVNVRLMRTYRGVFHPKVVWLTGDRKNVVWVGSNNLTKDGLLYNIEFAVLIRSREIPPELNHWAEAVAAGSNEATDELLDSYKKERERFERNRAVARSTTFTWSRKKEPEKTRQAILRKGDLIVEIMPEETRGGTQIQFPREAAKEFLGLEKVGDQTIINLHRIGTAESRQLIVTVFKNNTVRLSINELEYRDRPCVIIFRKTRRDGIAFEIVPENIFPTRYRTLIAMCTRQTRAGSRRWIIR